MSRFDADPAPRAALTSTTLLEGLRNSDNRTVWRHYVERFRPLLLRFMSKLGIDGEDAEDLAQSTLLAFSSAYRAGRYDRARGRLSSWLFGIARNEVRGRARADAGARIGALDQAEEAALVDERGHDALEELWEREWRDALLWECLQVIRGEVEPGTIDVFERFALRGESAEDVARACGTTPNAVFKVKQRVLARIRELMPLIEEAW